MIVVGGAYREECGSPRFAGLGGPGLRAAMALSSLSPALELHTLAAPALADDIRLTCGTLGIAPRLQPLRGTDAVEPVRFKYVNALRPFAPDDFGLLRAANLLEARGDCVLLLGLIEGKAVVRGRSVVYEPEPEAEWEVFARGPCEAGQLALVIKAQDFRDRLHGQAPLDAALRIRRETNAEVLVVRCELGAATVFEGDRPERAVGPYETCRWRRLGLGNVFTAVFAHYWAERKLGAEVAAREACLAAAYFNEGSSLPIPRIAGDAFPEAAHLRVALVCEPWRPRVRLEGPRRTYVERRLIEDAVSGLQALFADVETRFPLSDVDQPGGWTNDYSAMLLLRDFADADTLAEAARAAAGRKPVVAYAEYAGKQAARRAPAPATEAVDDLVTAIYRTVAAAMRFRPEGGP